MFKCPIDGLEFVTREGFRQHVQEVHGYAGDRFETHEDDETLASVVGAAIGLTGSGEEESAAADPGAFQGGGGEFGGAGSSGDFESSADESSSSESESSESSSESGSESSSEF
jgi:hypothetical protein